MFLTDNEALERPLARRLAVDPPPASAPPSRAAAAVTWALPALWARTSLASPSLDLDDLIACATRAERLDDFGDENGWLPALNVLLNSIERSAALNPLGRTIAHGQLVRLLRTRLRAEALWRRHPEILERPVAAPVIVLGQMRSGTTRVHRLLACDPGLARTRFFETMDPVPALAGVDARIARAWLGLTLFHSFNPRLAAIHPATPLAAEEEYGLLGFSFLSAQFEAQWRAPDYARWCEAVDTLGAYQDFKRLLQTIGWARGEPADRPWVLKAPQFMHDLDSLLTVFPDARVLRLDRPAAAVVASSSSLVWQTMRVGSDRTDPHWIGREWLRKTALRARRTGQALAERPATPALAVDYAAIDRDWRGEMRRVYGFLGRELTPAVEARMARFVRRSTAHASHRYALEDFGLNGRDVAAALNAA